MGVHEGVVGRFEAIDQAATKWMAKRGPLLLRLALGVVFFWFGVIKFVPGLSPADELATKTIKVLTFGVIEPNVSRVMLAVLETVIGVGLLAGVWLRVVLALLFFQMLGTVTPLVLFPDETWARFPISLTLEGQYIVKNVVLIAAGVVVGATVRGGAVIANPGAARRAQAEE